MLSDDLRSCSLVWDVATSATFEEYRRQWNGVGSDSDVSFLLLWWVLQSEKAPRLQPLCCVSAQYSVARGIAKASVKGGSPAPGPWPSFFITAEGHVIRQRKPTGGARGSGWKRGLGKACRAWAGGEIFSSRTSGFLVLLVAFGRPKTMAQCKPHRRRPRRVCKHFFLRHAAHERGMPGGAGRPLSRHGQCQGNAKMQSLWWLAGAPSAVYIDCCICAGT